MDLTPQGQSNAFLVINKNDDENDEKETFGYTT
jgi:hypothetical protein